MQDVMPFANAFSGSSPILPQREGYITKVFGIFLSVGPVTTVTGAGTFQVTGLANPLTTGAGGPISPGYMAVEVTPSTSQSVNVPIFFGERGVQSQLPGEFSPIELSYTPNGSDENTATMNVWGELVRVE